MRTYKKLLYVSHGITNETEGLKQSLSLARNNQAPLTVLIITPEFPKEFPDYQTKYHDALREQTEQSIRDSKQAIKLDDCAVQLSIEMMSDKVPAVAITQFVLQHDYDLVIKEAETAEQQHGFKSIDMDLLRKCPVPVWLCRPISHSRDRMNVAVAIDPESPSPAAEDLSKRLLTLARSLADSCSGTLHIISCWNYEFEEYLRSSVWFRTPDAEIAKVVAQEKTEHRTALDALVQVSGISGDNLIHHLHGKPAEMIPHFVDKNRVDVLVMGTVARTGIPGFMIGNTAEDIVRKLSCSLLALKPKDFVSPVKVI